MVEAGGQVSCSNKSQPGEKEEEAVAEKDRFITKRDAIEQMCKDVIQKNLHCRKFEKGICLKLAEWISTEIRDKMKVILTGYDLNAVAVVEWAKDINSVVSAGAFGGWYNLRSDGALINSITLGEFRCWYCITAILHGIK